MIYFDNSATTKPYDEVLETYVTVAKDYFGNPSSIHKLGSEAERLLSQSRQVCASLLGVKTNEIIFTSGGTEGNNIAIKGIALKHRNRGKHIITTSVEHASIMEAMAQLEDLGFEVTYLPVDKNGIVSVEDLKNVLKKDTILVSLIHVNNEMGSIQPIHEIAKVLEEFPKALLHVDHVQGLGKVPLQLNEKIDLCTISGHKFHGIKGTGILYVRDGVTFSPLLSGGGQEMKFRAGTENTPGIAAMTKALRLTLEKSKDGINRIEGLKKNLIQRLKKIDGIAVNTPDHRSAPHIINFSVSKVKPEVLINSLEKENIYVSTKSACSSKLTQASHVLMEAGLGEERASSAIRVSLSYQNTQEEIDTFIKVLSSIIPKLQKVMG